MGGKKLVNTFEDKMQTNLKRGPSYFVSFLKKNTNTKKYRQ